MGEGSLGRRKFGPEAGEWIKVGEALGTPSQHGDSQEPPHGSGLQSGLYNPHPGVGRRILCLDLKLILLKYQPSVNIVYRK